MRYIEGCSREQILLFPEVIDDYIEDDNPVKFIDAFVDSLDMKELEFKYAETKETEETQVSLTGPDARTMVNNQRIEPCYNVQFTVDSKNKLIMDYEVTNDIKDGEHLSEMAKRAKEILEKEEIEVLADKGYYNSEKIKECVDNGITPSIPEPESTVSKKIDIPKPKFYKNNFRYNKEKDVYICPEGRELNLYCAPVVKKKMMVMICRVFHTTSFNFPWLYNISNSSGLR